MDSEITKKPYIYGLFWIFPVNTRLLKLCRQRESDPYFVTETGF